MYLGAASINLLCSKHRTRFNNRWFAAFFFTHSYKPVIVWKISLNKYNLLTTHLCNIPIVRSEEDESIIFDPSLLHSREDLSYPPVQLIEWISKFPSDARVGELLAGKLWVVGMLEGHVQEEWGALGCERPISDIQQTCNFLTPQLASVAGNK